MPLTETQKAEQLRKIRASYSWTANFSDEILLTTIKKYPDLFDVEDIKWFVWGADPITGAALPAIKEFITGPIISGILVAIVALFIISKFK